MDTELFKLNGVHVYNKILAFFHQLFVLFFLYSNVSENMARRSNLYETLTL